MLKPSPAASELLELVKLGRVTLSLYLTTKVSQAVEPLRGRLRPRELAFVRILLEQALESDPVLLELGDRLRAAVGKRSRRT